MSYEVGDIINRGYKSGRFLSIEESFNANAVELVKRKIIALDSERISLVQGPPGTGKTTIFQQVISYCFDKTDRDEVFLYIAPTNKLVADMLQRIASIYRVLGKDLNDLKREVRVYGSRFKYGEFEGLRKPIDNEVKIVLSTEYQRVHESEIQKKYHLLIDEASKSPIHKPFITVSDELLEMLQESDREGIIASLNVIGDPKQAIALGDEYRGRDDLLLLTNLIRGLLPEHLKKEVDKGDIDVTVAAYQALKGTHYELLEVTRRLPYPSEVPISMGFYDGKLRAYKNAEYVLKEIEEKWNSNEAQMLKNINEDFFKVVDTLESAITTRTPIIYVHVEGKYLHDYLFNERRAKVGLLFSCAISRILGESVTAIAPYVDQQLQMRLSMYYQYGEVAKDVIGMVNFTTVHRMLGAEDSYIIAILGKENIGKSYYERTIYFMEPEIFNVQLSRHQKLIVIVGDLFKLRKEAGKIYEKLNSEEVQRFYEPSLMLKIMNLKTTVEKILEMAGVDKYKNPKKAPCSSTGNGCLFFKWDQGS
jgi:energy-coupling factor transporter ATP-binding protein EcfA2